MFLFLLLCLCFLLNIGLGSVDISFSEIYASIFSSEPQEGNITYIVRNYRLPKAITAILVGAGLSLSGLLMQTLFRNPLAGPFVLGISSGASLGAAILLMGGALLGGVATSLMYSDIALTIAASMGSFLVLAIVMYVASKVRDTLALLIIGLMFGSLTAAFVSILAYFADSEELQRYIFWTFGSVGNLNWSQVGILTLCVLIGTLISIGLIKTLNSFLLGEQYAISLGVSIQRSRFWIIIATGILAGSVTAFAGPIAFIGLAVPHLCRQLFSSTDHRVLVPAVMLYGPILLLLCDTVAQMP
ncbi:MAG: iron ABC transporter permease, partial [Eudoraea sp.]|nr:iron ABC transporter permease [Eudoraea sp.]